MSELSKPSKPSKPKRKSVGPYEIIIDSNGLTKEDTEKACSGTLIGVVAKIKGFSSIVEKNSLNLTSDELKTANGADKPSHAYLTQWKSSNIPLNTTHEILVRRLLEAGEGLLADQVCKKIKQQQKTGEFCYVIMAVRSLWVAG